MALQVAGTASMGYFYFDFRDLNKQNLRNLLPSLLIQLSARSIPRCDILSRLYLAHDFGAQKPSDVVLTESLKETLSLSGQDPSYIIIDALDECPNTSGMPSPREEVLEFVSHLVGLDLPNLRICVTSRPEIDIRSTLELLSPTPYRFITSGQKKDIVDYVSSVVHSDKRIRRWREEDKVLVIEKLSEKADGMEINKANRGHAHRLLQCLTVAVRPLRVEELAEVLAVDFNMGGIPKLNSDWRWQDQEEAVLSACSSLVGIVGEGGSRVVQFSHFSVKEFLTSKRLSRSSEDVSWYQIHLEDAHAIIAQACLGVLLELDDEIKIDRE
ncbi:hypothetical protein B0F90DRAFT_1920099 [Multifurca ochricompacta]|uniref:NACHT domain-containing protein n=1 Tax=Multifurca ochricompacta TaxID=376703 RepID=A0AAD4QJZ1_9AGAM|nr:hypothetical protein B0F90DRAFT_1920099 [Multifurca ochricompacta]